MKFLRKIASSTSYIAYHGSNYNFNRFSVENNPRGGNFFSKSLALASTYGREIPSYLYEVRLTFKNPLIIDCKGEHFSRIPFEGKIWKTDSICLFAKSKGFDGVIFNNVKDRGPDLRKLKIQNIPLSEVNKPTTNYVVFNNNQISILRKWEFR